MRRFTPSACMNLILWNQEGDDWKVLIDTLRTGREPPGASRLLPERGKARDEAIVSLLAGKEGEAGAEEWGFQVSTRRDSSSSSTIGVLTRKPSRTRRLNGHKRTLSPSAKTLARGNAPSQSPLTLRRVAWSTCAPDDQAIVKVKAGSA